MMRPMFVGCSVRTVTLNKVLLSLLDFENQRGIPECSQCVGLLRPLWHRTQRITPEMLPPYPLLSFIVSSSCLGSASSRITHFPCHSFIDLLQMCKAG